MSDERGTCRVNKHEHMRVAGISPIVDCQDWRPPSPAAVPAQPECACNASTGVCGCTTRGTGKLDFNGYWEVLCPHGNEVHTCNKSAAQPDAVERELGEELGWDESALRYCLAEYKRDPTGDTSRIWVGWVKERRERKRMEKGHEDMHAYLKDIGESGCEFCEALERGGTQ